ncbi:MAG: insulinase family protein [Candidatus Muirbacterium halophilum]|nr:insulinase family protein [Candidatus Muirbacterium halophilum]MCK9476692.1 insulinase family protein [Candidatus Muirbacterium halophilum]
MEFEKENSYHGFKLVGKEFINEIKSGALIFEHQKSGARLIKLENEDDNKVFAITFRTPPGDNTGLPHILEHSVLCGSKNFDSKEPFVELIKGSLNTFLNAMTFPDKTMYPVASKNEKDFFNLMNVYLDATLYPKIHDTDLILMQEGWHYEIEDKNDPLQIKGVVYNEMKGAFSSPVRHLYSQIESSLFPDTAYGFESGGDPDYIPELTQKKFTDFHSKYYHPSNSYIFLYGNGNTEKELEFINNKYLNDFNKISVDSRLETQKPFHKPIETEIPYSISEGEDIKDKTYLALSWCYGKTTDVILNFAVDILEYILLSSPAALLKKEIISRDIAKDVMGIADNGILQPVIGLIAVNSEKEKMNDLKNTVNEVLKDIIKNGIDKELLEASINRHEFKVREAEFGYPKGLVYHMISMNTWLYDSDPLSLLRLDSIFNELRNHAKTGFFEKLIEDIFLKNNHASSIVYSPIPGLTAKNDMALEKALKRVKENMSEDELQKIINDTKRLIERQNSVDTAEILEKIPLLKLEDINKKAEKLPMDVISTKQGEVFYHELNTNGILYYNMFFNTNKVSQKDLPYARLLTGLIGKMDTLEHNYSEISNNINIDTGGIKLFMKNITSIESDSNYNNFIVVTGKSLYSKNRSLFKITSELLNKTLFTDKKRLKDILNELKNRMEMEMLNNGHVFSERRVFSYLSESGAFVEATHGISYYKFLKELVKDFDDKFEDISNRLKNTFEKIFTKENLLPSIICEKKIFDKDKTIFEDLLNDFSLEKFTSQNYTFTLENKKEGLQTPSQVQYVAKAGNFKKEGFEYSGSMKVMKTIAGLDYLWNKVRVLGGAYGCFLRIYENGLFYIGSYRDPGLENTLNVYNEMDKYLENFATSDREMRKYIIGTFSELDRHMSSYEKGFAACVNSISGKTQDLIQKEREQALNTDVNKVRKYSEMFRKALKKDYICVFGNEKKIEDSKNIFNNLVKVID